MSEKYQVRKCQCGIQNCPVWTAIDSDGYRTHWNSWERAMLRATREW